jgi:hypothetical protein
MRWLHRLRLLWCLPVLFVLFPETCFAVRASKIVLHDGTSYDSVVFVVEAAYKTLTMSRGDWERTVSFGDIAAIYGSDGADITEAQLGMVYAKPKTTTPSVQPAARPDSLKADPQAGGQVGGTAPPELAPGEKNRLYPWSFALRTGANFSIPATDFYDGFKSGIGFDGDLMIPAEPHVAVRLSGSLSGIKDDPEQIAGFMSSSLEIIEDNVSFRTWRFLVSVEYYEWPRWRTDGKWMYFIYSGLGAAHHTVSGEYIVRNRDTGEELVLAPTGPDVTKFMVALGFGGMVKLAPHIALDGTFEIDGIVAGSNPWASGYYNSMSYAYIFDFKAGVVWLF